MGQLKFRSQWVSKIYVSPTGTNYLLPFAYALLFALWALSNVVLIPVTVNLIATSVAIIYIGCHRSLALRDRGAISDEEQVETISKDVRGARYHRTTPWKGRSLSSHRPPSSPAPI